MDTGISSGEGLRVGIGKKMHMEAADGQEGVVRDES